MCTPDLVDVLYHQNMCLLYIQICSYGTKKKADVISRSFKHDFLSTFLPLLFLQWTRSMSGWHLSPPSCIPVELRWSVPHPRASNCSSGVTWWPPSLPFPYNAAVMKTASRAQPCSSPPLVQMRRYSPGVYPFLFPSVISSLPPLPPASPQRLQIQQPSSSGSTPSPVGEWF